MKVPDWLTDMRIRGQSVMRTIAPEGTCQRCHHFIEEGQETELMPWVPRWGWSFVVHKGCEPAEFYAAHWRETP